MFNRLILSILTGWFVVTLGAVSRAETRLDIRTLARHGGTAITEVTAQGATDLQVHNQATRGGTSTIRIDAGARDGGHIRGRIYGGSRGGTQHSELIIRANGPGALIDMHDASLAHYGEIDNRKELTVEGNSRLRWRSQQFAESAGAATTRHDVRLQAEPGSRNRVDIEMLTDGLGYDAFSRVGFQATSRDGGVGRHRVNGISIGHGGRAAIDLDIDHRAWGGTSRSDITATDIR